MWKPNCGDEAVIYVYRHFSPQDGIFYNMIRKEVARADMPSHLYHFSLASSGICFTLRILITRRHLVNMRLRSSFELIFIYEKFFLIFQHHGENIWLRSLKL